MVGGSFECFTSQNLTRNASPWIVAKINISRKIFLFKVFFHASIKSISSKFKGTGEIFFLGFGSLFFVIECMRVLKFFHLILALNFHKLFSEGFV